MYSGSRDKRFDRRQMDRRTVDGRTMYGGRRKKTASASEPTALDKLVGSGELVGFRTGKAAIVKHNVPGGSQLSAYWPDARGNYPVAFYGPDSVKYSYPGTSGYPDVPAVQHTDFELERAGMSKPAGFEDCSYFVRPSSSFGQIVVDDMFGGGWW